MTNALPQHGRRTAAPPRRLVAGSLLALVTVSIWAIWIVITRQAVTVDLPIAWVGMLRFAIPALLLLPVWWRTGLLPAGLDRRLLALMVIGAGAPFFLVAAAGMRFGEAAEVGVLLPGTMPLFVAITSGVVDGERFGPIRIAGFLLTIVAMAAIGGPALWQGEGLGIVLAPIAAMLWAFYTIAFRRAGIDAFTAAGLIAVWSTLLLLPVAVFEDPGGLMAAGVTVLAGQVLSQAVLSGFVAIICYGAAVRLIGASRAAIFSALAPALAALFAIPVLGEVPAAMTLAGVGLAVAGVALGTGAVRFGRERAGLN